MLTDPYCQAFIEAMAAILVHLSQQREGPPKESGKTLTTHCEGP